MTRPVRRVGLYGYLGSGNLGNDASLEAVLTWLRSTYPDLELRCITIAPDEVQARYGIRSGAAGTGAPRARAGARLSGPRARSWGC